MSTSGSEILREVGGRYFDGRSSRARPARLAVQHPDTVRVLIEGDGPDATTTELQLPLREVRVSQRLGSIPRRLVFPDGASFETTDNAELDQALAQLGQRGGTVHWLEAHAATALAALVLVVAFAFGFVRYADEQGRTWGTPGAPARLRSARPGPGPASPVTVPRLKIRLSSRTSRPDLSGQCRTSPRP